MTTLVGLDLSLTATAMVAVPLDWDGEFRRVHSAVIGERLTKGASVAHHAARTQSLADRITGYCIGHRASVAYIESPAFNMRTSQHALGELHGVVKVTLLASGIDVRVAQVSSVRKFLLGRIPRGKGAAKAAVKAALVAAGAPEGWSLDEFDAMAVVNWALSDHAGAFCLAQQAA